jgi:O-antigen/teichoic acid export membrane protein
MSRRILTNTLAQLVARAAASTVTFAVTVMLARSVGAVFFGDFVIITTYVSLFALLTDAGLNAVYVRDSDQQIIDDSTWNKLLSTRIILATGISLAALIFFVPMAMLVKIPVTSLLIISFLMYLPVVFFQSIITTANAWFQKNLIYHYHAKAMLLGAVSTATLLPLLFFVPKNLHLPGTLGLLALSPAVGAFFSLLFVKKTIGVNIDIFFDLFRTFDEIRAALPLFLALVLNALYLKADMFLLSGLVSPEAVGIYGYAYKFFELLLVFPTFLINSWYPQLIRQYRQKISDNSYFRYLRETAGKVFIISLVMAGIAQAASFFLVLLAPNFSQSQVPFQLLCAGLPVFFLTSLSMWSLIIQRKYQTLITVYAIGLAVNIILNFILIPKSSYNGAAAATVITEFITLLLSWGSLSYGKHAK